MALKKPYLVVSTDGERQFPITKAFRTRKEAVEYVNNSLMDINKHYGGEDHNYAVELIQDPEDESDNEGYINIDPPYAYFDYYIIDLTDTQR